MVDLEGKVAIVTGASSGIGAALSIGFSKAGTRVTLVARRKEKLKAVAAKCPGEHLTVTADVTEPQGRRDILEKTLERWGSVDILVNNAGMGAYGHFSDTTEKQWRDLFEINLFAPVLLTREVLKIMQIEGKGLIINLASIGGLLAHSDKVAAYAASKHALLGFSRGLAKDLNDTSIRVLAACPHLTATEFFNASLGAEALAPAIQEYQSLMDTPEDVARGILDQLDAPGMVIFPTNKTARIYEKKRDI